MLEPAGNGVAMRCGDMQQHRLACHGRQEMHGMKRTKGTSTKFFLLPFQEWIKKKAFTHLRRLADQAGR